MHLSKKSAVVCLTLMIFLCLAAGRTEAHDTVEVAIIGFQAHTPEAIVKAEQLSAELYTRLTRDPFFSPLHKKEMEDLLDRAGLTPEEIIADPRGEYRLDTDLIIVGSYADNSVSYHLYSPRSRRRTDGAATWKGISSTAAALKAALDERVLFQAAVERRRGTTIEFRDGGELALWIGMRLPVSALYSRLDAGKKSGLRPNDRIRIGTAVVTALGDGNLASARITEERYGIDPGAGLGFFPDLTGLGALKITSSPDSARVYIDNHYIGRSPLFLEAVPARSYTLRLTRENYSEKRKNIQVAAGKITAVELSLAPLPSAVRIESNRPAEIYIDGKRRGTTPRTEKLAPGRYEITVRVPGYPEVTRMIFVRHGRDLELYLPLHGKPGSLEISSKPERAKIELNGRYLGRTPKLIGDLSPGYHDLRLTAGGRLPHTETILVTSGETKKLDIHLKEVPGTVRVKTAPAGAAVYIGEKKYGYSPVNIDLQPGRYTLRAELDGHSSPTAGVSITSGESRAVELELKQLYGSLTVESEPSGAAVYASGRHLGTTPLTVEHPAGMHLFRLESGELSAEEEVRIIPDQKNQLWFELEREVPETSFRSQAMITHDFSLGLWGTNLRLSYGNHHRISFGYSYMATRGAGGYGSTYSDLGVGYSYRPFPNAGFFFDYTRTLDPAESSLVSGGLLLTTSGGNLEGRLGPAFRGENTGVIWEVSASWPIGETGLGPALSIGGRPERSLIVSAGLGLKF